MFPRKSREKRKRDHLRRAVGRVIEPLESRMLLAVSLSPENNWVEQGPRGLIDLRTGDHDSGAVQAVAIHPNFVNLAYAASANGGIWKTTNFLAATPTWTPLTDLMPSLSMGAIAFSPLDPSGATVFAGSGAFSSFARHSGRLTGLMRTTDGGTHWEAFLGSSESGPVFARNELSIHTVLPTALDDLGNPTTSIDSQLVLIAASQETIDKEHPDGGGIFRSTDGGRTVERVLEGSATDVIADPTDPKRFYAAVVRGPAAKLGLYVSVDAGKTWQLKNGGLAAADLTKLTRVDLEASNATGNPIYAALIREVQTGKDRLDVIARLSSPTGNWVKATSVPNVNTGGSGSVHFSMIPDPANADVIYVGGDRNPDGVLGDIRLFNMATAVSETLVRGGANDTSPHADSRDLQFVTDSNGKQYLIDANDGGVFRYLINDPTSLMDPNFRRWVDLNSTLGTTEMVEIAYDTINKRTFSGNIDNGTTAQIDGLMWREVIGGDGFAQAYATEPTGAMWYSIQNSFMSFYRRPFNAAGDALPPVEIALAKPGQSITPDGSGTPANQGAGLVTKDQGRGVRYVKLAVNRVQTNRLIIGHHGLYESDDRGDHVTLIHTPTTNDQDKNRLRALAYGHTGNPAIIYAGRQNVISVSEAFATPTTKRTFQHFKVEVKQNGKVVKSADRIRDIVIDPDDWRIVYVISTSDVFRSTDAGKTWSFVSNPAGKDASLTSLLVLKQGATPQSRVLVVSSGIGTFFAHEAGGAVSGDWLRLGNNLPRAFVIDLEFAAAEDKVIAGTLGRGRWSLSNATSAFTGAVLTVTGTSSADDIVISRSDDNPEMITVMTNGMVEGSWDRRSLSSINVLAGDGSDTIRLVADDGGLDPSNGNGSFLPSGTISVNGGTGAGDTNNQVIITGTGLTTNAGTGTTTIVTTDGEKLLVNFTNNTTLVNNVPTLQQHLGRLRSGLQQMVEWSGDLRNAVQGKLGGVGDGLGDMLEGFNRRNQAPISDPEDNQGDPAPQPTPLQQVEEEEEEGSPKQEVVGSFERAGTEFLRRLFEEGVGAFELSAIGAPGGIGSPEALRDRLIALDNDPTTTTTLVTDAAGNPSFDFTVVRRLNGAGQFDVEALDGLVTVGGIAGLEADVRVHLRFGIDSGGFFINADPSFEPEITVSNISGSIEGAGRIGFLGVTLANGQFVMDSDVKLTINLRDPGTIAQDGMIRLEELVGLPDNLITVAVQGDAGDGLNNDIVFTGDFAVDLFNFQLPALTLGLRWANAEEITNIQLDPGATLQSFLDLDSNQFINSLLSVAEHVKQIGGVDILAQKLPLLEKSANDLLGGAVDEVFTDTDIIDIGDVFVEDGFRKFQVVLNNINASARGIVAGNVVSFKGSDAAEHAGVIDVVDGGRFVVRFDMSDPTTPFEGGTEMVKVTHQATLRDQINSALGDLADPISLTSRIPTLQDLSEALGVDLSQVKLSSAGDAIEVPIPFKLDPIHFSRALDLGTTIAGLKLSASGNIDIEISPSFLFTAGVRFGSGVPLAERLYIAENSDPDVTLDLKVTLDNPTASGSIGFLDVELMEDGSNDGIQVTGALKLNLTDPGGDGRILLTELTPGNLLSSFDAAIDATFVVNPIKITASLGPDATNSLGQISLRLDAADGHVTSLADLTALPSKFQITGASNFANFQNITPQMIVAALQALIEKLRAIGGGGVLDTKLPVIDKSLSELVDLGEAFANKLGLLDEGGVSTAKKLEEFLQTKLGNAVVVTVAADSIQFKLNFSQALNESLPFALNLGDSWGLLQVQGGGTVNFTGSAAANISFGLLTGPNLALAQRVYFDTDGSDASNVTISGSANLGYGAGSPFDANVTLGLLEFGIQDARALIELTQLLGALKDPGNSGEGAGRLTLQEIADKVIAGNYTDILDGDFTGRVQIVVPLDGTDANTTVDLPPGPGSTDALIEIAGKLENLPNGLEFGIDPGIHSNSSVPLTLAQLNQPPFSGTDKILVFAHNLDALIASAVLDFDNLLAGLQKLIEWGDKLLGIGVLDFKLPFTGAKLRDAINFFKDPNGPVQTIIAAISASGGLGSQNNNAATQMAANKIKQALQDIPGVTPIGNLLDVQTDSGGNVSGATFKFKIESDFSLPLDLLDFDLGLDFFSLQSNAQLTVSGKVELLVGLGIDKSTNGFYLITDFEDTNGNDVPELAIKDLKLSVSGNSTVDVGFLELGAAFDPLKNFVAANFSANLNGLNDGRLTLSELADFSRLPAVVDGNAGTPGLDGLSLNVEAKMDVPLTVSSNPNLPAISTNFHLQWGPFTLDDVRNGATVFTTPLVELKELRLNPGEFIEKYALPFFQTLDQYNVLAPLIDKLDDPLPIIGGTLFDLLITNNLLLSQEQRDMASFLFNVSKTINDFGAVVGDTKTLSLNFGDIGIRPDRSLNTTNASPSGQAGSSAPMPQMFPGDHLPFVGGLIRDMGELGITFPMLSLGNLMQLFMGNDTDLIFADLPELHAGKIFEEEIPIYSVGIPYIASATVNILFGGSIDLFVNLSAGLDSSGIRKGLGNILDGLYIGDFAPGDDHQIGPGDAERPEVYIEGSLFAGINAKASLLGFDLLKVTGKASIGGAVGLDLNDDNDNIPAPFDPRSQADRTNGKFYIGEIQTVINSAGGDFFCMFDILGEVFAELSFEIHVPLAPNPDWSDRWTLIKFDIECEPTAAITPDLADIVGTALVLTSTTDVSHAAYHTFAATNHPDGDVIEIFRVDKNGDLSDGLETLRVTKHGFSEDFGPGESGNNLIANIESLTLITDQGDGSAKFALDGMGIGPDSVTIAETVRIPARLSGGEGNDTLTAGDGGGTLLGGTGDDRLALALAPSGLDAAQRALRSARFEGGDGNDQIFGGVGNDTALGNEGNDTIDGGGSDADSGTDTVVGGGGDDVLDGRGGGDLLVGDYDATFDPRPAIGQEGSDFIFGGSGDDSIWGDNHGGPDPDPAQPTGDFIYGDDGADLVNGGPGGDSIDGGAGNDTLNGEAGDDTIAGAAGNDLISGADGNDSLGGDADEDTITGGGGNDSIHGGEGNDSIEGNAGDDTARGQEGNDQIFGNDGGDQLHGDGGDDTITGGTGDDQIHGGTDQDTLFGNEDSDTMFGDAGNDSMLGGTGGDSMNGNDGNDTMLGNEGDDLMFGDNDDDDMIGGDGNDTINGGAGVDVMLGDNGTISATAGLVPETSSVLRLVSLIGSAGAGNDVMSGGDDGDAMFGQAGNDTMSGDAGMDSMEGNQGSDSIDGGADDDDLIGGSSIAGTPDGADSISGGDGHDAIAGDNAIISRIEEPAGSWKHYTIGVPSGTGSGLENNAVIRVVALLDLDLIGGNDVISGGNQDDTVFGQIGDDTITGDEGDDDLIGHLGADFINGGGGDDAILGDKGTIVGDLLDGSMAELIETNGKKIQVMINVAGTKKRIVTLISDALDGNDVLLGGLGNDSVHGGGGNDLIRGDDPAVSAEGGNDALFGNGGADSIYGDAGFDHLYGGGDDDLLDGNTGADLIYGGGGDDSLYADVQEDALIDWFGNFNNFYVPGPGYGSPTILRSPNPHIRQFLFDLASGDGSTDPEGELQIVTPPSPENSGPGGRS